MSPPHPPLSPLGRGMGRGEIPLIVMEFNAFVLLSFVKVMELIFGEFVWGRGGFSLPKSGRLKSPLPMRER